MIYLVAIVCFLLGFALGYLLCFLIHFKQLIDKGIL